MRAEKKCRRRVNGGGTWKCKGPERCVLTTKVEVDVAVLDDDGLAARLAGHGKYLVKGSAYSRVDVTDCPPIRFRLWIEHLRMRPGLYPRRQTVQGLSADLQKTFVCLGAATSIHDAALRFLISLPILTGQQIARRIDVAQNRRQGIEVRSPWSNRHIGHVSLSCPPPAAAAARQRADLSMGVRRMSHRNLRGRTGCDVYEGTRPYRALIG